MLSVHKSAHSLPNESNAREARLPFLFVVFVSFVVTEEALPEGEPCIHTLQHTQRRQDIKNELEKATTVPYNKNRKEEFRHDDMAGV